MGYVHSLLRYLKTSKGKHDMIDYLRAMIIIVATMVVLRNAIDIAANWVRYFLFR
ncbi:putative membrane protein [Propionispora sp. 2/2-37]|uniref:hypothetical protein n=1 Tax=Propionispora sp. 2/2-37 TaxID=1677858 RepID=UPI0006C63817|nr:hypothetical protein [Propionispora sp. 2/2-37]CUH97464.1 putative membrane protein [Propionispora sp. 2/2-37]